MSMDHSHLNSVRESYILLYPFLFQQNFKRLAALLLAIGVTFIRHLTDSDSQHNGDSHLVRLFGGLNKIMHEISR